MKKQVEKLVPRKERLTKSQHVVSKILMFAGSRAEEGVTADECNQALRDARGKEYGHQTISARYNELVQAKCLVPDPKGQKRRTSKGTPAIVHVLKKGAGIAHYRFYMRHQRRMGKKVHGITDFQQRVLDEGLDFLRGLVKPNGKLAKERLILDHIERMAKLSVEFETVQAAQSKAKKVA